MTGFRYHRDWVECLLQAFSYNIFYPVKDIILAKFSLPSINAFNMKKKTLSRNRLYLVDSLPNDKLYALSRFKAFANDKSNVAIMMISVSYKVENSVGNGENAGYQHFLLFPQCFQEASPLGSLKVGIVW